MTTQIVPIVPIEKGQGNTNPDQKTPSKEVKQANPCKDWFFTYNNWIDSGNSSKDLFWETTKSGQKFPSANNSGPPLRGAEVVELILAIFGDKCSAWCFQKEICPTTGTPHLQGCITLKVKGRWTELGLPKSIHWEVTRNSKLARRYCCKDATRDGDSWWMFPMEIFTRPPPKPLRVIEVLRPWQQYIVESCLKAPDARSIHWLCDLKGGIGKTDLAKYMAYKHNALFTSGGSAKDVACYIANTQKTDTRRGVYARDLNDLTTFVFDIPRCTDKISYKALEMVKNGAVFSGKYESNSYLFNAPHVWIFSNEWPRVNELSKDRWNFYVVNESQHLCKCEIEDGRILKQVSVHDGVKVVEHDKLTLSF
nr:MAG: replication associated protein [Cressdnaviricota sp.]